jgi:Flp pilus assembly protein TadG
MLALMTLILPVLLGAMALGSDFAIIYFNWALVQKAVDAAALAGASQLTGASGSASSVKPAAVSYVNGYACLNGITDPNNTNSTLCPSPATKSPGWADKVVFTNVTDTQVSVGIHRSVPYFFGKMIGLQEASVAATATAAINPTGNDPRTPRPRA